jgi:hypothetical protein
MPTKNIRPCRDVQLNYDLEQLQKDVKNFTPKINY